MYRYAGLTTMDDDDDDNDDDDDDSDGTLPPTRPVRVQRIRTRKRKRLIVNLSNRFIYYILI